MVRSCAAREPGWVSLFSRVVAINAGVLVAAALVLALSPATVSPTLQVAEAVVLAVGTALMISVNLLLLRRVFGPLEQLTALMRLIDPHAPGRRLRSSGQMPRSPSSVTPSTRCSTASSTSGGRAAAARLPPRRANARGSRASCTTRSARPSPAWCCNSKGSSARRQPALQEAIVEMQESARAGVEDVREIARGLRPQALDEFGLRSALISLASQVADRTGLRVRPRLEAGLPALAREQELAIFRVAQESLTNVARHAEARNVSARARAVDDAAVVLIVRDDGRGITAARGGTAGAWAWAACTSEPCSSAGS